MENTLELQSHDTDSDPHIAPYSLGHLSPICHSASLGFSFLIVKKIASWRES